jgi:hypothetical protein
MEEEEEIFLIHLVTPELFFKKIRQSELKNSFVQIMVCEFYRFLNQKFREFYSSSMSRRHKKIYLIG